MHSMNPEKSSLPDPELALNSDLTQSKYAVTMNKVRRLLGLPGYLVFLPNSNTGVRRNPATSGGATDGHYI